MKRKEGSNFTEHRGVKLHSKKENRSNILMLGRSMCAEGSLKGMGGGPKL